MAGSRIHDFTSVLVVDCFASKEGDAIIRFDWLYKESNYSRLQFLEDELFPGFFNSIHPFRTWEAYIDTDAVFQAAFLSEATSSTVSDTLDEHQSIPYETYTKKSIQYRIPKDPALALCFFSYLYLHLGEHYVSTRSAPRQGIFLREQNGNAVFDEQSVFDLHFHHVALVARPFFKPMMHMIQKQVAMLNEYSQVSLLLNNFLSIVEQQKYQHSHSLHGYLYDLFDDLIQSLYSHSNNYSTSTLSFNSLLSSQVAEKQSAKFNSMTPASKSQADCDGLFSNVQPVLPVSTHLVVQNDAEPPEKKQEEKHESVILPTTQSLTVSQNKSEADIRSAVSSFLQRKLGQYKAMQERHLFIDFWKEKRGVLIEKITQSNRSNTTLQDIEEVLLEIKNFDGSKTADGLIKAIQALYKEAYVKNRKNDHY